MVTSSMRICRRPIARSRHDSNIRFTKPVTAYSNNSARVVGVGVAIRNCSAVDVSQAVFPFSSTVVSAILNIVDRRYAAI